MKVGTVIYWKTMFNEWFKGEITAMDADFFYVHRTIPVEAYGVRLSRKDETVCTLD